MKGISYFLLSAIALLFTVATITSCDKDKTEIPEPPPVDPCPNEISFSATVEPIMVANCSTSGCHDAGTATQGYDLEGHSNISLHADIILSVIKHETGPTPMPFGQPKLNDSIIQQFDCWIVQGKLDN